MSTTTGPVEISICMAGRQPPKVDAIVEEQDTNLLLDTKQVIRDTRESYRLLVNKMARQKPLGPGQVIFKNTQPARLIAILYDLEHSPVCSDKYITTAFNNILDILNKYKLISVAMPLLGSTYGKIPEQVFIKLLQESLTIRDQVYPGKIVLMVPPARLDYIRAVIGGNCNE